MLGHTTIQHHCRGVRYPRVALIGVILTFFSITLAGCLADSMDPVGEGPTSGDPSGDDPTGDDPIAPLYTVSGSIEGLVGDLSLAINDEETVTVSSGDTFSFETGLESGENYAVSVVQQPDGQHCDVEDGEGTITTDVTDVTILCAIQAVQGVVSPSSTRVTVDWEDTGADSYSLYWSSDPDFDPDSYAAYPNSGMAASVTPPYEVIDLSSGSNYYFRIVTSLGDEELVGNRFDTRTFVPGMDFSTRFIEQTDDYVFVSGAKTSGADSGRFGYMASGFEIIDQNSGNRRAHPAFADTIDGARNLLPNIRHILPIDGETLIVAGRLYRSDGENEHDGIAMIDGNGSVVSDWKPQFPGNRPDINAMAYDEDSGVLYVAGDFDATNAPPSVSEHIAAIDLETGETLDWPIALDGSRVRVNSLSLSGGTLYVSGEFDEVINKETSETAIRYGLAAFDLDDGRSLKNWGPNPNDEVQGVTAIGSGSDRRIIVIDDDGTFRVYDDAGDEDAGFLSEVNDFPGAWGEKIHYHDGTLYLSGWYEDGDGGEYSLISTDLEGSIIHMWDYEDIGWVYAFGEIDGDPVLSHENPEQDTRTYIGFLQSDEIVPAWELSLDSVPEAIGGWAGRLAVGGGFAIHSIVDRDLFAVLDNNLEWDTDWPDVHAGVRVSEMILDEDKGRLYLAGPFQEMVDGEDVYTVPYMAAIDINNRTVLDGWPVGGPDRAPTSMAVIDDMLLVGGRFDEWGGDAQFSRFILIDGDGQAAVNLPEMRNGGDIWTGPSAVVHDSENNHLYFSGRFDEGEEPGGFEPRSYFSRLDLSDMSAPVLDSWGDNLSTDGHNNRTVSHLVFRAGPQYLYAAMGGLEEIDDGSGVKTREGFVGLSADAGLAEVLNWNPDADGGGFLPRHALWAGHGTELILGRETGLPGSSFGNVPVAVRTDGTGANLGVVGPGAERPVSWSMSIRTSDGRMCFGMEDSDARQMDNDEYRMGIICFNYAYEQAW